MGDLEEYSEKTPEKSGWAKKALDMVKSLGPYAISLSEEGSVRYADHLRRLANVDAYKVSVTEEAKVRVKLRGDLLERLTKASPEERLNIQRNLRDLDSEIRHLNIYNKSLEYIEETEAEAEGQAETSDEGNKEDAITQHWVDRFIELAKMSNEPWREDLLARALASEAGKQGSISLRALWLIGTMDEKMFHAFASILDLSTFVNGNPIVPSGIDFNYSIVPNCALGNGYWLGLLTYMLSDVGFIGDLKTAELTVPENKLIEVSYDNRKYLIKLDQKIRIPGIAPTEVGLALAKLYTPKPNTLGKEIFEKWFNGLDKSSYEIIGVAKQG